MVKVVKFGGSSLADAEQFKKVAAIIKSDKARRFVVASAPGKRFDEDIKVTDMLYSCYKLVKENKDIDEAFKLIEDRYNGIIKDLGLDFWLQPEFDRIKNAIVHHAGRDYIASRGEYLNSMILAKYLDYAFIDAEDGIFFTENGELDTEKTNEELTKILKEHTHAVVPGFYGVMPNGTIKTFSRGGSDITGSIVARAISADIYENWTDVSGMLMADPRCVKNPKVINTITYRELRELSYMGATVMHEDAIFPVREKGIPINIRNTNRPEDAGTMIVSKVDSNKVDTVITGIAGKKGFSVIAIEKDMMNSEIGFGRKVLEVLENHKICFEHLPSGIDTMSVVVNDNDFIPVKDTVIADIQKKTKPDNITIYNGIALVAVVGRGMAGSKGTASRLFKAIANSDINIRMIDQGSSELNIIVGVAEEDYVATLEAIYNEFVK
ncbi:MAG: aspartate kinase [Clostridia bacterium]|nr:aspartate kinase [Clostridia bacterium]MBR3809060.1 aspartate kinase [Clostridia bacterium]